MLGAIVWNEWRKGSSNELVFKYTVRSDDHLDMSHLSSIGREYSSVFRVGGGFAGGGGRRSAQFIVLCLGTLGVRTPFF